MLPPLITSADMSGYGYDVVSDAVLARASTRVRRYTKQQITPGTSTVTLTGAGPWLLPQRPVNAVMAVLDRDGNTVSTDRWELRGQFLHTTARVCPPLAV